MTGVQFRVVDDAAVAEKKEPMYGHCGECSHEWVCAWLPMPIDKVLPLMKAPCPKCGSKNVLSGPIPKPTNVGAAEEWVGNGDTGTSSLTIWAVLMDRRSPHGRFDVPHDPDDFGRCYRLLQVMPEWRARLPEVAQRVPAWGPFVREWDTLTALYEDELQNGPLNKRGYRMLTRTYDLMQKLRAEKLSEVQP